MFNFMVVMQDQGFMDRYVGFYDKASAMKAFNWFKNRPCCQAMSTTVFQGAFDNVSWTGYTTFGRTFTVAHQDDYPSDCDDDDFDD